MAPPAVHVSDVLNLDQVPDNAALALSSSQFLKGVRGDGGDEVKYGHESSKFMVIGHRGSGMNMVPCLDGRMKSFRENSILSFNAAAKFPIDFIEFDVQVTKDGCPVIFHDGFILTEDKGAIAEKRVTNLTLAEFRSYGTQEEPGSVVVIATFSPYTAWFLFR